MYRVYANFLIDSMCFTLWRTEFHFLFTCWYAACFLLPVYFLEYRCILPVYVLIHRALFFMHCSNSVLFMSRVSLCHFFLLCLHCVLQNHVWEICGKSNDTTSQYTEYVCYPMWTLLLLATWDSKDSTDNAVLRNIALHCFYWFLSRSNTILQNRSEYASALGLVY